jgi:DNA invertase Pin-like site-specific DNA recombinase
MTNDNPIAEHQAHRLRRRAGIEDIVRDLGEQRSRLTDDLASVEQTMREIVLDALEAGVPLDTYAKLVGVSRPTVYRWRDDALKLAGRRQKVI